jgi:hypothetical protein
MGANSLPRIFDTFGAERDLAAANQAAERNAMLRQQATDAEATRYLAEMTCPADVVEFGRRHAIPSFAEFTWQAGFMAGWRAAQTRKADGSAEDES